MRRKNEPILVKRLPLRRAPFADARRSCGAYFASRAGRLEASSGAGASAGPAVACIAGRAAPRAAANVEGKSAPSSASTSSTSSCCGRMIWPAHVDGLRLSSAVDADACAGIAGKSSSAMESAGVLGATAGAVTDAVTDAVAGAEPGLRAGAPIADVTNGVVATDAAEGVV